MEIILCKDGQPVKRQDWWKDNTSPFKIGVWPAGNSPYGLRSILRTLGLSDHVEIVRRESEAVSDVEYMPNWRSLADALATVRNAYLNITKETGDVFPVAITEKPGTVYAECNVKDGADALALLARKMENSEYGIDEDGHFMLNKPMSVVGIMPGVTQNKDGVLVPCVYVLYKSTVKAARSVLAEYIEAMANIADMIAQDPENARYTLKFQKKDKQ